MLVLLFGEIYQFDVHSTFVITLNLFMQTHATKHICSDMVKCAMRRIGTNGLWSLLGMKGKAQKQHKKLSLKNVITY
ncbi:hypothetical protein EB796_015618 [Bugula neritina]|uniref:Uncharacterized protein n=1 Tax=Bugula neritina TaxID=10212 RepID=A0A7J7JIG4_BUGNE|nr:hypothetical protein EB796_015618 [Bugula neritina]